MNRFAALLDRLAYEPRRLGKLALLEDYFRATPDPDRGWALAAMTGALSFKNAKAGLIRTLAAERADVYGLRLYVESENRAARATYLAMGMEETRYVLCEQMTRKR